MDDQSDDPRYAQSDDDESIEVVRKDTKNRKDGDSNHFINGSDVRSGGDPRNFVSTVVCTDYQTNGASQYDIVKMAKAEGRANPFL